MRIYDIKRPDKAILEAITHRIDSLNKPKGSMGRLESLATQVCLIQQTLSPELRHPCHILLGADHGIEREGVSVSPRDVTWQQMINFANGGGGLNFLCRQHGFRLRIVDIGVDHDLSAHAGIANHKIAMGTRNFRLEAAMTEAELDQALTTGAELADECSSEGCNVICLGEMGIGNTSPSSVWMSLLGGVPLADCVGAGAGLNDAGVRHKLDVLGDAVRRFKAESANSDDPVEIIRHFGGFEMVGAIGAMLRAAELGMVILVDGFIMTACALAASTLYPEIKDYMIFGHQGDESGHAAMLRLLDAKPILNLGMRLGEGTGALCAFPIIDSAVRMINEMNTFENANITKYF